VAAEFDVTDKLTFRAGAAYYHRNRETKETTTYADREDENWTARETKSGDKLGVGPQELFKDTPSPGDIGTAYQAEKTGRTYTTELDETDDWTTYHLGLGYQFTENLQFDLMWTKDDCSDCSGNSGVDLDEVFASITLAF
jgi:long-subunit fatty acid transport protein